MHGQDYISGPPTMGLSYEEPKGGLMRRFATPKNVFVAMGVLLLAMLCIVPVWNAMALMQDVNYVFWVGSMVPTWMICLCAGIVALYCVTVFVFFSAARPSVQTEQTIMMIANVFITLLGLVLMLLSLPLSRQSTETYNNLMHRCDYSEQTHRMYEYSQVLHNIRAQPGCAGKFSVEECTGYEDAPPYTTMLKAFESSFHCSGFCYHNTPPPANKTGLLSRGRKHKELHATALVTESVSLEKPITNYPPTLFSDANYQASCEGMAARDMKNFAGDVGFQTFYQGIYLVLIAITTGFLKLFDLCKRQEDTQENDLKAPGF